MAQYKTPNVYVQEKSIFPPSVAEVATAIPAFIGRTQISGELKNIPQRITSMVEFASLFGGPSREAFHFSASVDTLLDSGATEDSLVDFVTSVDLQTIGLGSGGNETLAPVASHLLYPMVEHFFANGGGACHVVSIGDYDETGLSDANNQNGEKGAFSAALEEIAKVDEVTLLVLSDAIRLGASDYYALCQSAMNQCRKNQDRFTIIDALDSFDPNSSSDSVNKSIGEDLGVMRNAVTQDLKYGAAYYPYLQVNAPRYYDESMVTVKITGKKDPDVDLEGTFTMSDHGGTPLHSLLKTALGTNKMVLPPAAAMAGIYSRVDGTRGVWKAPANAGVSGVLGPVRTITNSEQEDMNVDTLAGKSVNAIRAFTGKGTLVWGARTLAGNDNEWRYVPVRRLFNMVEESVQKATGFAVFEPNVPLTWLKLRTMISSYLESLWKQGALFGATADQAFFVNVGLGQTMTEDDINNGVMNIEIGLAAVRPAEFIVLTFSHKSISS
ncbi:phage tail sheath family protein [Endozoicomonas elysicola]|uniref:Phage tail sheath protein n=1 Tax=Endozoicomonas elysicola TaxID=305900 RepID=A0A081KAN4_9GAMM|nr:phage tail sheath C-terminal domain-containing protein [Endozoicomonas elysicola]KEI71210.1 phage tail sheath protein [Endozoicomonas elysicola]